MLLYLFLLFSHYIAMGSMNTIKQEQRELVVSEGRSTSLSCEYTGSIQNIQWYRQYQRSRPEFLLYITEGGTIHPTRSDFSAQINKTLKRVNLLISSAAVTDSAVYYCAVEPTVTGNTRTLYKNLQYTTTSTRGPQKSSCSNMRWSCRNQTLIYFMTKHHLHLVSVQQFKVGEPIRTYRMMGVRTSSGLN
ncbi:hypothetical protein AMECASPLE_038002 [Ameca splendens]|uniref:Ig-like domain-containing protein n=1 Tax=Ameca splendens TaxID=208324 RepID=A0ABV0Z5Y4_9TELE